MKTKHVIIIFALFFLARIAVPCTRVVYKGPENLVITARSMDWNDEIPANLWLFPREMQREGKVGPSSITWQSKYGSIVASSYDVATVDGMNEKGLVANILWLTESEYPTFSGSKPGLSIAAWAQYILDNFATVDEAVNKMAKEDFVVVSSNIPGTERFATCHLSISDASGDNAVFEYVGGKLVIHHDPSYVVMTNSPVYEQQLALNAYWQRIPGTMMLPGTNNAADRFVRASYYINAIPKTSDRKIAVASVFSVIRNCSVPYGISSADEPNISSTRWRTVSDQKHLTYYFESVLTPNTFWVDLNKVDFGMANTLKLSLANNETYEGNAFDHFEAAEPFEFAGL
ncbi:linear amide C-N hydrolase [Echinicola vietnamensis]|uniref:Penicillin V acylase-like amidase n=1 Tax=Echinicola vietnamensis (strain DSM 17526 / LMG 23754 / KMM 6221) TaxID=926556 RepID=L0G3J5_ECHVK|nr:linear amide C-N hydrolase [Echinicola vietnamensis]AGA79546.1 penicillin V acylase-like amidase [Echinicola vietnamensis DSM 17526]